MAVYSMESEQGAKQKKFLCIAGFFAVIGSFLPVSDYSPPQVLDLAGRRSGYSRLLLLPGVGVKRATEIRKRRILDKLGPFEGCTTQKPKTTVMGGRQEQNRRERS